MTTKADTEREIDSGRYIESDTLTELQQSASEAWDAAGAERGPWQMDVDVADLTKLCNELIARRAADV